MHRSELLSRRKLYRLLGGSSVVVPVEYLLRLFATPERQAWADPLRLGPRYQQRKSRPRWDIAVVDARGNLKAFVCMDGSWMGGIDRAQRKARTARSVDVDTDVIGTLSQPGGPVRFTLRWS